MIIGFISDAHGNDVGLERCLAVLKQAGAESIYFLGDSVGYMPHDEAVLNRLVSAGATCIRGNHEEMLLGKLSFTDAMDAAYRLKASRSRILPRWTAWIESWPIQREVVVDGLRLLLVHGSPMDPLTGYVFPDSDLTGFEDLPYDVVLLGHTHRPFIRTAGPVTCVNVGSCGLPRDVGNLASCAVLDSRTKAVEILRVEFDASSLIGQLGNSMDDTVVACLRRKPSGPITGRIVNA